MTPATKALIDYLRKMELELDDDWLRQMVQNFTQAVIELEAEQQIGAGRHERSLSRTTQRNGYRERGLATRVGELELRIPKLRTGSFFPSLLEPRRRAEKALVAVVQEAYVEGVSTRKVDDLLIALGLTGIDKSAVSRACKALDAVIEPFRTRPLGGQYPYVWLDALYLKVRQNHRIVSKALVIAIGVRESGEREVLGWAIGASEEQAFWSEFLRSLVGRGLAGVQLVVSDAHEGLKAAIAQTLAGAAWQRCRVHFTLAPALRACASAGVRNLLAHIPHGDKDMVAAVVRTIFAQPDRAAARLQVAEVATRLETAFPKAAALLRAAEDDVLAYMSFPREHWTRIYSTNVLERLNREVKRRTDVVQVFPNDDAALRLAGAILLEIGDEWAADERRYFSQASMQKLFDPAAAPPAVVSAPAPRAAPVR
jgi:transposase-like protein